MVSLKKSIYPSGQTAGHLFKTWTGHLSIGCPCRPNGVTATINFPGDGSDCFAVSQTFVDSQFQWYGGSYIRPAPGSYATCGQLRNCGFFYFHGPVPAPNPPYSTGQRWLQFGIYYGSYAPGMHQDYPKGKVGIYFHFSGAEWPYYPCYSYWVSPEYGGDMVVPVDMPCIKDPSAPGSRFSGTVSVPIARYISGGYPYPEMQPCSNLIVTLS